MLRRKKDLDQIANNKKKKIELDKIATKMKENIEIETKAINTMNAILEDFKNKPALDYNMELIYMAQTSIREEQLKKLKDYEGLKKILEKLIEKNDSLQTKLFELKMLSLNKFNYVVGTLNEKQTNLENNLQTNKDKNETRRTEVNICTNNFKEKLKKLKRNTTMQVILKDIQEQKNANINYQKIVDDKMLENIKNASEVEVEKLKETVASIKLELKKTIEKTKMMRHDEERMYKSQILELDIQINYLKNDNYKKLKEIEKVLEEEVAMLRRKILSYEDRQKQKSQTQHIIKEN
ncbi:18013_t:CDS:2 [Gigaspora margarita]|uniref:18013_t:CDS:1 n=1 Tax=Gigaspora margarita TaxID=4874 RepID=A0ABN7VL80_GIGMA|nr:18013_t:CDS:2 [Gigaspora margarita]